jgi:hypothetical protein
MRRILLGLLAICVFLTLASQIDMAYPQSPLPSKTVKPTPTWEQIVKPPTRTPVTEVFFPAVFEQQGVTSPK